MMKRQKETRCGFFEGLRSPERSTSRVRPNARTMEYLRRKGRKEVRISFLNLLEPGETGICVPGLQGVCGEGGWEDKAQEDAGERGKSSE